MKLAQAGRQASLSVTVPSSSPPRHSQNMGDPSSSPTAHCPHCEREVPAANFDLHAVHCKRNLERCDLCQEMVPKVRADEHFQELHAPVKCVMCNESIERELVVLHQNEKCPQRLLACCFCEFPVAAVDFDAHVNHCGNRTERCIACGRYVRLCEKLVHDLQHHDDNQIEGNTSPSDHSPADHGNTSSQHRLWVTVAITGIAILIGTFVFQRREPIERQH